MNQVSDLVREMELDSLREMISQMESSEPTIEQEVLTIQKASNLLHLQERLHRILAGEFRTRFPDLESLIPDFENYARVASHLATNDDISEELTGLLSPQQVVALNLGIPNLGPKVTNQEFLDACQIAIDASNISRDLSTQAARVVMHFAPNLCELVGAEIASILVSFAGGLRQLSQTAACNIKSLGAKRTELLGYSSRSTGNFHGVVYNAEIVMTTSPEFREVVFRDLVNKVALVSRVDAAGERRDGSYGRETREKIMTRLDKRMTNTTPKVVRPLPVPGLEKKVNRGGRQKRAMKKKFGMGEELTARNKVVFGIGGQYDELGEQYGITALKGFRKQAAAVDTAFQKKIDKKLKEIDN